MIPPPPMVLLFMQTQSKFNLCTFFWVHFHEIPFKTIFFMSLFRLKNTVVILPMFKGTIHYQSVWFLFETTFAYFSNHHLSKTLKQLVKNITSFTEHSFNEHPLLFSSLAALHCNGMESICADCKWKFIFQPQSHDMRQMKVKVL